MADKLMYILNDDTQYYPFCRLKLEVETFVHSTSNKPINSNPIKVPKVVEPSNKKTLM